MPLTKSRYALALGVVRGTRRSPRTSSTGARLYVPRIALSSGAASSGAAGALVRGSRRVVGFMVGAVMRTCSPLESVPCRDRIRDRGDVGDADARTPPSSAGSAACSLARHPAARRSVVDQPLRVVGSSAGDRLRRRAARPARRHEQQLRRRRARRRSPPPRRRRSRSASRPIAASSSGSPARSPADSRRVSSCREQRGVRRATARRRGRSAPASSGVAASSAPSSPERPTAARLRRRAPRRVACSPLPDSAMRTISRSSALVTRRPPTNAARRRSSRCSALTSSPPPCTTTSDAAAPRRMRRGERRGSAGSSCGRPPILMTRVMPAAPRVSSRPSIRFAFCTAWPAAPFTRLSIADVTSSVGVRVPAIIVAAMRTTLRCTTSRSAGGSVGDLDERLARRTRRATSASGSSSGCGERDGDRRRGCRARPAAGAA